ncbi:hypothetical protein [Candidatus Uabimicrobium sp. HlEnr_7]|uniref:hypothetical protein n=1 Tax=Candidatus Uabimicrobium helgolandensis TaxID=3095367 RepID=UPI0035583FBB
MKKNKYRYIPFIFIIVTLVLFFFMFSYLGYKSTYTRLSKWARAYEKNFGNINFDFAFSHFSIYETHRHIEEPWKTYYFVFVYEYRYTIRKKRVIRFIAYYPFHLENRYIFYP